MTGQSECDFGRLGLISEKRNELECLRWIQVWTKLLNVLCSENNRIKIWNNGKGIPVVEHKQEKMYVPTLIFGHLLTSSNYNDFEKKVTGTCVILSMTAVLLHHHFQKSNQSL